STYPKAVLLPESIKFSIRKGPTVAKVTPIAIQVWHEAFGLPVPTLKELAARKKAAKAAEKAAGDATVALLRRGRAGIEKVNKLPLVDRVKADFRHADLSGCDMAGVIFGRAKLDGADLSRANLSKAVFGAAWYRGSLRGTKLIDADLTEADLTYCDLKGAD